MAALVWDQPGTRFIESGVSNGVLYGPAGWGVSWNGLIAIEENEAYSTDPVHFDGVKFNDIVTFEDFSAIVRAFTYPDEFLQFEGVLQDQTGFYVTGQTLKRFGLSYQTRVGSDADPDAGYKIHVLYNLTAVPSQVSYQTLGEDVEPAEFEWTITAIPDEIENFRPTAHLIFDSRKMDEYLMQDIKDILYGDEDNNAHLPPLKGLATFIRKWGRLVITDWGDGRWEAYSPVEGVITMLDATTFEITSETAVYIDPDTYEISSEDKNEEDLWPL